MKNREKIKELESQRDKELKAIEEKYKKLIKPLYSDISFEEIKKAGWVKYDLYLAGSSEDYTEYFYTKGNMRVRVGSENSSLELIAYILTDNINSTKLRKVCDLDDLEHYYKTGE